MARSGRYIEACYIDLHQAESEIDTSSSNQIADTSINIHYPESINVIDNESVRYNRIGGAFYYASDVSYYVRK